MSNSYHPYHLVDPSPWPYKGSIAALLISVDSVLYFHYSYAWMMYLGAITIILTMFVWRRDVIREATFQGHHTQIVKRGLRLLLKFVSFLRSFGLSFIVAYLPL